MVKTKYQCEVCNGYFNNQEEAKEHERMPVENADLPRGLVFRHNRNSKDIYYIIDKRSGASKEFHSALYDEFEVDLYFLEKKGALGVRPQYDRYITDISSLLVSDEELEQVKEKIRQAQNDSAYAARELYLNKVNLEELTNKLK